jgi:hypothetical protein
MAPRNEIPLTLMRTAAAISAITVVCASVCWGQSGSQTIWKPDARRRILVSIPDRKLAVIEHRKVARIFRVAVGAPLSPTPTGTFESSISFLNRPTSIREPSSRPV